MEGWSEIDTGVNSVKGQPLGGLQKNHQESWCGFVPGSLRLQVEQVQLSPAEPSDAIVLQQTDINTWGLGSLSDVVPHAFRTLATFSNAHTNDLQQ